MFARIVSESIRSSPIVASVAALGLSCAAGLALFSLIDHDNDQHHVEGKVMTFERARLQAMIENAQQSTRQENLDNALQAQERFMLPRQEAKVPDFMIRIDSRSKEIMREHEMKQECDDEAFKRG